MPGTLSPARPILGLALICIGTAVLAPAVAAAGSALIPRTASASAMPGAEGGAVVRSGSGSLPQTGGSIVLPVEVLDVQDLGAATVRVNYDRTVISATGCIRSAAFDVGLCNRALPDAVRMALISVDGLTTTAGVPLNLASITWSLVGEPPPGVTITLQVSVTTFTDEFGLPLPVVAEPGYITVTAASRIYLPLILARY